MESTPSDSATANTSTSYNRVATEYTRRMLHELDGKPFDRELLDRFATMIPNGGVVADLGCGPGHVGRYLHDRGVRVCGLDISEEMIRHCRELHPGIEFSVGDMSSLPYSGNSLDGIVAFYSLIHIPPDRMVATLGDFHRALKPGAPLLLSFHIGDQQLHLDEWWGEEVSVDFYFFQTEQMTEWLREAGFEIREVMEREPYGEDVEHQSRRGYVVGRSTDGTIRTSDEQTSNVDE